MPWRTKGKIARVNFRLRQVGVRKRVPQKFRYEMKMFPSFFVLVRRICFRLFLLFRVRVFLFHFLINKIFLMDVALLGQLRKTQRDIFVFSRKECLVTADLTKLN